MAKDFFDMIEKKHKGRNNRFEYIKLLHFLVIKRIHWDFPDGAVVKNPPAIAGDTGSSPGPGRAHMLWSN